jgi:hypothetical protein
MIRAGLLAALMLSAAPASAAELKVVTVFTPVMMEQIYRLPTDEARSLIADSTILGKVGAIDAGLAERLPFGADMVLHFAENGDLLAWSDKSAVVEVGYWELIASGGFHDLCVRFGSFGLDSLCASIEIEHSNWIVESTPGNPFGLVGGAAVPMQIGTDLSLEALAERVQ